MMLPSTGKFKEINCPFFNSSLCERPYCHFRHVKKDSCDGLAPVTLGEDGQILQQLVSEAVRKVLERTEIVPGALVNTSGTNPVESVSETLVNKVVEELAPPLSVSGSSQNSNNSFETHPKIPSYKPTPIAVLKRRHIPIPYSPSLAKNSTVLRKRTSSDEILSIGKKVKSDSLEFNGFENENLTLSLQNKSSSLIRKEFSSEENICDVSQYSPAPVSGWKTSGLSYTPSSIESLSSQQNAYIPSSKSVQSSVVNYEPSDKSVSGVEPVYEPLAANGLSLGEASYEPSTVSNTEPEYQPNFCDIGAKEYVPTDISKLEGISNLDLSSEIDLLHDILEKEITDSESSHDHISGGSKNVLDTQIKVAESKVKCDSDKKRTDSSRRKSEDKRQNDNDKKKSESSSKKKSECDKKRDESKRRDEGEKKSAENRKKKEHEKRKSSEKKESGDKKRKESDQRNIEKKRIDNDKKKISETKKGESEKKKSEDKKKGETEKKRRHSDSEKKNEDSSKKHSENGKKCDTNKKRSDSDKKNEVERRHSDSERRCELEKKSSDSHRKTVFNSNNHHKHSLKKREDKKYGAVKSSEDESYSSSDKKSHSKHLKSEGKRKGFELTEHVKSLSLKQSSKDKRQEETKKSNLNFDKVLAELEHGISISDSELSDGLEAIDDVTLPSDPWASSSDEDAITKECFKIFQEYDPTVAQKKAQSSYKPPAPVEEIVMIGKKRVAHDGAEMVKISRPPPPKRPAGINPTKVLSERFKKVKEAFNAQAMTNPSGANHLSASSVISEAKATASQPNPPPTGGKVRIAHVPNVNVLLNAKLKMQQQLKERQMNLASFNRVNALSVTKAQTATKGAQRIAHVPSESILSRPVILDIGGKIPTNVRQRYLDMLVDEFLKVVPSEKEAFERAQQEEKEIHSKSKTRNLYASHISNTVSRLRKSVAGGEATSSKMNGPNTTMNRTVSHTSVLAGKGGAKGSWSIEKPRKPPTNVTNKSLYEQFMQFAMSEEQLKSNGFPMAHAEEKGVAVIHAFYKKPFVPKTPCQRMCARCSRVYYVNQQGKAVKEEQCIYHWGRLFQSKTRGGWEARYNCCQGHGEAIGCSVGSCHVSDNFDPNNLRGFVKTLPKDNPPPDGNYGIYALDCEMCYTTMGLELTRVTVIGTDLQVVYETLVKPESPILDYNTRFSGIKEEDMVDVTTNIYEVQSVLLSFISDKTVLVGHSLESDFKALKLIHETVVDTSVVYPHKMGPPKKRALKSLCREILQKIIQESDGGHDSAEDARAAMEIMMFKVKEEMKSW